MRRLFSLLAVAMVLLFAGEGSALPPDPAARGLDLFLHLAKNAAPGGSLEVLTEAFGFATATKAAPLSGATIEAGWDPEELDGVAPPPPVTIMTDAEGKGTLAVPVPRGLPRQLTLLVGVRHGAHSRTRKVSVHRAPPASVEIHTIDTRVVPMSTISSWVRVAGISGQPIAGAAVNVALLEGGVARHTQKLVTDKGGLVMARVPIPRIDEPVWEWTLRATAEEPGIPPSDVRLHPREETPGKPTLEAKWEPPDGAKGGVLAGDKVPFSVRLRDATGQALSEHTLRYWIGQRGTAPPANDEEWAKQSTLAKTDGGGRFTATKDAPTLVKTGGTALLLLVKTVVEGHALEQKHEIQVGVATASIDVTPESEALVPGLTQKIYVHATDGRNKGIAGTFKITGDGLNASLTTNAEGEGEVTWNVPPGVGATRNVGPCAGGVAAAVLVKPEGDIEALRRQREGFNACVSVDRDAGGLVRVEPTVAKPGDKVRITVTRAKASKRSFSALSRSQYRSQSVTTWLEGKPDGSATGEITLPSDAGDGLWSVSVASPDGIKEAAIASAGFMVVPRVLPMVTAKRTGGRATPGGTIDVEAQLTDGAGHGLPGSISGIVVDAFGGGRVILTALDTRLRLCGELGIDRERCNDVLANDPKLDALRRSHLASMGRGPLKPEHDPGGHAEAELKKAFADVLHSLEGAVFESTKSPQTLIDVRRKENGRWVFNPELLTLVTDAMSEPPLTPGGERITLPDLVAVDPQVTFDNVARRVTRLKLFRILQAVRDVRSREKLDPDEPVFKDPNALVRRLVRTGSLTEDVLLDPWGGTIQFVQSNAQPVPFLTVARGWELRAPGPDGLINTGDDVRDPFQRVLNKGTPYATAVEEDRIVDAKWDMVVSEETVQAWQRLFEELTGTQLGAGGLGLSGTGEGGGGRGEGIGLGSVGTVGHGAGRGTGAIATGDAFWTAPVRTDAEGRVRLSIPLGDVETTWRIAFVGVPDGAQPAATSLDVASELPLSSRVDVGARWVEGDVIDTHVLVRNRGATPVRATVTAAAEGAATIDREAAAPRTVDVPANGARTINVRVSAKQPGTGTLVVTTRAPNLPDDVVRHTWEIVPAGEHRYLTRTAFVDGERKLAVQLDHGYRVEGTPRVVLERGYDDAVAGALDSLEPERQTSTLALLDSYETALRIERWATTKTTPRHKALAAIAHGMSERALGRFFAYVKLDDAAKVTTPGTWTMKMRARLLSKIDEQAEKKKRTPEKDPEKAAAALCPPEGEDALDAEPPPGASIAPCWGAYVADRSMALERDSDAEHVARGLLAMIERPHRAASATSIALHLRAIARLGKTGELDVHTLNERSSRAIVYAALLRSTKLGPTAVSESTLFGKLAELRDANGGYGSSTATLYVVRALLASQLEGKGVSHVRVRSVSAQSPIDRRVDVPESGFVAVPLPSGALDVEVETAGAAVVARFERPVLRLWTRPPPPQTSPVAIEVTWPAEMRAATTGTLRVSLKQIDVPQAKAKRGTPEEGLPEVDARIPLPPGVTLAASVQGVAQIQGALFVRQSGAREGSVLEIPVRFGLSGRMTAPEASARMTRHASPSAFAPARSIVVR